MSDPRFMQGHAVKTPQEEPVGMALFTLSCSSHVACQTNIRQKVFRGACPARAFGLESVTFPGIRFFPKDEKQNIVGVSSVEN